MFFKLFKSGKSNTQKRKTTRKRSQLQRQLQEIHVDQLQIGMYVRKLDIPWEKSSFMFQGIKIETEKDILAVKRECTFVWVDYTESGFTTPKASNRPAPISSIKPPAVSIEDEYSSAKSVHSLAQTTVRKLFDEIRVSGQIDSKSVRTTVSKTVDSILRNPDASIWLTRLKNKDEPTAQHSLNVAGLSIILGRNMGMTTREMEDLGICAMLHDVGKTSIPSQLLNKKGPLSDSELSLMRSHTKLGRDILLSTNSAFMGAADVAFSHHERPDGKGYPRGLSQDEIPLYANIIAITEAYDTISTQQPYQAVRSPSDALQIIYSERGKQFDDELVIKFIDSIGVFPPGSVVEMSNGEVGIVLSNTNDKLRPRVILLLDKNKDANLQRVMDLSQPQLDADKQPYKIATALRDGEYGIFVDDFQRAGLRIG